MEWNSIGPWGQIRVGTTPNCEPANGPFAVQGLWSCSGVQPLRFRTDDNRVERPTRSAINSTTDAVAGWEGATETGTPAEFHCATTSAPMPSSVKSPVKRAVSANECSPNPPTFEESNKP